MKASKWNLAVNDRERRRELEARLFEIDDFLSNRYQVADEEDRMEDERIFVMRKDREAIVRELEMLGGSEARYQEALEERGTELSEISQDVRTFLEGIENVTAELNEQESLLSESLSEAREFQKQFEGIISSLGGAELPEALAGELRGLSQQIYNGLRQKLKSYTVQIFDPIRKNLSGLGIWDIYMNNDELISNINEQLQRILAQKIELQMRREAYLEDYETEAEE